MRSLEQRKQKGFTLIELMVSMFIGLIVFGGVFTTFKNQKLLYSRQEKIIKINQDTRAALSIIKNYVKRAGVSVPDCSANDTSKVCTGLEEIDHSKYFVITSDLNLSGSIDVPTKIVNNIERISFVKGTDNSLYICPNKVTNNPQDDASCQFLLDNIKTLEIKACSTDVNAGTTTCSDSTTTPDIIDSIQITLQAETKDKEITENDMKLVGSKITARIFFINKTFQ